MNENVLPQHINAATPVQPQSIDPQRIHMALQQLRSEQNLVGGICAGLAAAVLGAAAWALVTVVTGYQIGWMAIGVGLLVGLAVRAVGKGMNKSFAFMGATLALGGCLLGNLLTVCHFVAAEEGMGLFGILTQLNPVSAVALIGLTFSPIDLLFYGLAVTQAFSLSSREVSDDELLALAQTPAV
jgi:hypothetical protein